MLTVAVAVLVAVVVPPGAVVAGAEAATGTGASSGAPWASAVDAPADDAPVVDAPLRARADAEGEVPVLVALAVPDPITGPEARSPRAQPPAQDAAADVEERRAAIARAQTAAIDALASDSPLPSVRSLPSAARQVSHRYQTIPGLALMASAEDLAALERVPEVARIVPDGLEAPALADAVPHVEGDDLRADGHDGAGHAVAVLDTGVDVDHPAFAGDRVVDEACFARAQDRDEGACPDGSHEELGEGAAAPVEIDGMPNEHGTHVAGIAAGAGVGGASDAAGTGDGTDDGHDDDSGDAPDLAPGVAPGAHVLAVQVFHPRDVGPRAWRSDILAALDHLVGLAEAASDDPAGEGLLAPLAAANLSRGSGSYGSVDACEEGYAGYDLFADVAAELAAHDVAVVSSAGNGGNDDALSAPACVEGIVSVSATELAVEDDDPEPEPGDEDDDADDEGDDADGGDADGSDADARATDDAATGSSTQASIAGFADVAEFLDLLAPGVGIASAVPGGGVNTKSGTSMAAPMVAGAWAALQGATEPRHPLADVLAALEKTGSPTSRDALEASHPEVRLAAGQRELAHPTPHELSLDLAPDAVLAGSTEPVVVAVAVRDAADQPVVDRTVTLTTDGAGHLGEAADETDDPSTAVLSTDAEGRAETVYRAHHDGQGDEPGSVTLTAASAGLDPDADPVTATLTVWDPDEPTLALTVDPEELTSGSGDEAELTGRLQTRRGDALPEETITFAHDGAGTLAPTEASTDGDGVATATYAEDDEAGDVGLTATHDPDPDDDTVAAVTATVTLTIVAAPTDDDSNDDSSGGGGGGGGGGGSAPAPPPDSEPDPDDDPEPDEDPDAGQDPNGTENADARATLERVAGNDRYATAARLSAARFEPGVSHAYLATGTDFADALAGAVAAARVEAPLLLVPPSGTLPQATATELSRLAPERVVLLGGTSAVGEDMASQVRDVVGHRPTRVEGADRYATAAAIAADLTDADTVVVATGEAFPDGLSGAPVAADEDGPLLLTRGDRVPEPTAQALARLEPSEVVLLGGTQAVSQATAEALADHAGGARLSRLGGDDRYDTAALAAARLSDPYAAFVATGGDFADALAGAAVAGAEGSPMLLTTTAGLPAPTRSALTSLEPDRVTILGGPNAVSSEVEAELRALLGEDGS